MRDLTTPQRFYVLAFLFILASTITVNIAMNAHSKGWGITTCALMIAACITFFIGLTREGTRD